MFYGRGAGGSPTASAVLGDLDRRRHQPAQGLARVRRSAQRGGAPPDRRRRVRLLPQPRGARPPGRARAGRRRVRRPRRVDPLDGAGGPRRRGPAHLHHPPRPRGRRAGHARRARASSTPSTASARCSASSATTCDGDEVRLAPAGAAPGARLRRRAAHRPGRRRRAVRPRGVAAPVLGGVVGGAALRRRRRRRDVALRRGLDRARRLRGDGRGRLRHLRPPRRVPGRRARRPPPPRAVLGPDARVQGRGAPAGRPAVRPRARRRATSGPRSSSPPRATPARPPSRRASAATRLDIVVLHPAGPGERRAAPPDDHGRRAQRPQRGGRGHLRRLPGPGEGAVRRRRVPRPRCACRR